MSLPIFATQNLRRITTCVLSSLMLLLFSAACQGPPTPAPTVPSAPTMTFPPPIRTSTPTPFPLGTDQNPFIMGVVAEGNPAEVSSNAEKVAQYLTQQTGFVVHSQVYERYDNLIAAMEHNSAHLGWLPPFSYIIAHRNGGADAALMTNHYGAYGYGFRLMANANSGLVSYYDQNTNQNTARIETALAQLQGKRPCWSDPRSASGYVAPLGMLTQMGLTLKEGALLQSATAVVRALYIQGICDFGATYATYGDPRTASNVQTDLPDVMTRVIVLWQSDAVIPNLNLSFSPRLTSDNRQKIIEALLKYVKTEAGKAALTAANNQYAIEDLRMIDDTHYDTLRALTTSSGVPLYPLMGK